LEAVKFFESSLSINKNQAEAYLGLGQAFQELNEIHKAIEAFKSALELDSKLTVAHFNIAYCYF
jgi:tetratricopeptide (TPR) repeat protein